MSGTAFNGSPWVTAAEMGALVMLSFGGAAMGAYLYGARLQRNARSEMESEIEAQVAKASKRRRIPAYSKASAEATTEEIGFPPVTEDLNENGAPPS